jgi:hypothetical protein
VQIRQRFSSASGDAREPQTMKRAFENEIESALPASLRLNVVHAICIPSQAEASFRNKRKLNT